MKEKLLHFIWKLKLFSFKSIQTTAKEKIELFSVGTENLNSGPDFLNAKIRIDKQLWVGNVEIHIQSSDWYQHQHEIDENYDSVILHVVWEHDVEIFRKNNDKIPTLELKNYIPKELLINYDELFSKNKKWINCENDIKYVNNFVVVNWLERLYFERLEQKSDFVKQLLLENQNNWEATLFVLMAKGFGLKVNNESFVNFATSFDFSIVRKISNNKTQLEALFFGQAGLLSSENEAFYFHKLKKEYEYLKTKFKIKSISKGQVQFFRLRPHNFPTIRLSQLAFLYHKYQNLFSKIIEIDKLDEFYELFEVLTFPFWETHYTFDITSKKRIKKLSKSFIDLLLINTIIPLKFVHLKSLGKNDFSELFLISEQIKPERNSVISNFNKLNVTTSNAFKTQALLQLKNEYCNKHLCLQCAIGKEILKN
ncbi:MAG: DUF2851 family protein [Lutibacter sp.]|uniref:DUF2851 family protein n=1 Tax=Lutibacter sp. TaxID=1925666 RepID=UPI0017B2F9EF|nr:DUF2851 family protein [Lutibacter sp.]MBT8316327.1 DUF2851 family protein [Lutibacter sp.]NNJ57187.1 DUF2851 family protein [Lutibacter sp.]